MASQSDDSWMSYLFLGLLALFVGGVYKGYTDAAERAPTHVEKVAQLAAPIPATPLAAFVTVAEWREYLALEQAGYRQRIVQGYFKGVRDMANLLDAAERGPDNTECCRALGPAVYLAMSELQDSPQALAKAAAYIIDHKGGREEAVAEMLWHALEVSFQPRDILAALTQRAQPASPLRRYSLPEQLPVFRSTLRDLPSHCEVAHEPK